MITITGLLLLAAFVTAVWPKIPIQIPVILIIIHELLQAGGVR